MIRYGLLGAATVWEDGREVELGSPQQRALFALLLLHRNRTVSTDRMADVLWPAGAPANAVAVLRTYVARLARWAVDDRRRWSPGRAATSCRRGRVRSTPTAWRPSSPSDAPSSNAATRPPPRRHCAKRSDWCAGRRCPSCRTTTRPPPTGCGWTSSTRRSREELVEARLAQGDHRELVPALRAAVAEEPLRERAWGQLMVALYRCGRQAEALDAYREAYAALGELGVEPGTQLRDLERMILLQDSALDLPPSRVRGVPRYATSLVGREAELDAIEDDVRAGRLVSLVGPAGAGKTRLAAEVAVRAGPWLGARVWWVDLGAVGPGRVIATTSRTLAVSQVPGRTAVEGIIARLGDAPGLLVLDNCEHVIEEAATLAARLLEEGAYVRILATSRGPLRLGEERVHRLVGLEPEAAARLFAERAESPLDHAAAVAEIVARLDGLPLAIELAAARLRSVSVTELARGLRERLSLLGEGPRDAPARQRTLETSIAWSYDLLGPADQRALRRLAVFPGTFDTAAAEAVVGEEVLPTLARLIDASLVAADPPRYRLLMTVRTFALRAST